MSRDRSNDRDREERDLDREERGRSRDDDRQDRGGDRRGSRDFDKDEGRGRSARGVSLLVKNLSYEVRNQDLRDAFSRVGEVKDVYMPKDYYTGKPRGFAFVEFIDRDEARNAQEEMDRTEFFGRKIEVIFAQERRKTPNEMRRISDQSKRTRGRSNDRRRGGRDRRSRSPRRRSRSRSRDRRSRSRSRGRRASRSPDESHSKDRRGRSVSDSRSPARVRED